MNSKKQEQLLDILLFTKISFSKYFEQPMKHIWRHLWIYQTLSTVSLQNIAHIQLTAQFKNTLITNESSGLSLCFNNNKWLCHISWKYGTHKIDYHSPQ